MKVVLISIINGIGIGIGVDIDIDIDIPPMVAFLVHTHKK